MRSRARFGRAVPTPLALNATYHVDGTAGNDAYPGTDAAPFKTIGAAQAAIRAATGRTTVGGSPGGGWTGAVVAIRSGTYRETLSFDDRDMGTDGGPVVYRADIGASVTISGAAEASWSLISAADPHWSKFPAGTRAGIYKANLSGVVSAGSTGGGYGGAEQRVNPIVGGKLRPFSRFPNSGSDATLLWDGDETIAGGWMQIQSVSGGTNWGDPGSVVLGGNGPLSWDTSGQEILAYGNWAYEWAIESNYVTGIASADGGANTQVSFNRENSYGLKLEALGSYKIAFWNAMEAIKEGTCVYLAGSNVIYYLPVSGDGAPTGGSVTSVDTLVTLSGADYVSFRDITFEGARNELVSITGCAGVRLVDCVLRNAPHLAVNADEVTSFSVDGGSSSRVGRRWGHVVSGDKVNFVDGESEIKNHTFTDIGFYYQDVTTAAVAMDEPFSGGGSGDSCGVTLDNLTFSRMRGGAVALTGARLSLSTSSFSNCNMIDGDNGTINAGFRFTSRYNTIKGCTFSNTTRHTLNHQSLGALYTIYCDSQAGWTIQDNTFSSCDHAILVAGGYGNVVRRNKFTNCHSGHNQSPVMFGSRVTYTNVNDQVEPDLAACNLGSGNWAADTPPDPFPSSADLIACRNGGAQNVVLRYHRDIVFVDNMSTTGTYLATIPNVSTGNCREGTVSGFICGIDRTQLNYAVGASGTPAAGGGDTALSTMDKE